MQMAQALAVLFGDVVLRNIPTRTLASLLR